MSYTNKFNTRINDEETAEKDTRSCLSTLLVIRNMLYTTTLLIIGRTISIIRYLLERSHSILGSINKGTIFTSAKSIILEIIEHSNSKFA